MRNITAVFVLAVMIALSAILSPGAVQAGPMYPCTFLIPQTSYDKSPGEQSYTLAYAWSGASWSKVGDIQTHYQNGDASRRITVPNGTEQIALARHSTAAPTNYTKWDYWALADYTIENGSWEVDLWCTSTGVDNEFRRSRSIETISGSVSCRNNAGGRYLRNCYGLNRGGVTDLGNPDRWYGE